MQSRTTVGGIISVRRSVNWGRRAEAEAGRERVDRVDRVDRVKSVERVGESRTCSILHLRRGWTMNEASTHMVVKNSHL